MGKKLEIYKIFDHMIIGSLAAFIIVMFMLVVSLSLHSTLQHITKSNNAELQKNLEELRATTDELQSTVSILLALQADDGLVPYNLTVIEFRLEEVNSRLEALERHIAEPLILEEGQFTEAAGAMDGLSSTPHDEQLYADEIEIIPSPVNRTLLNVYWIAGIAAFTTILVGGGLLLNMNRKRIKQFLVEATGGNNTFGLG